MALLSEMEAEGVTPNAITYNVVLTACDTAGEVRHPPPPPAHPRLAALTAPSSPPCALRAMFDPNSTRVPKPEEGACMGERDVNARD
jgi:hypothetical protein